MNKYAIFRLCVATFVACSLHLVDSSQAGVAAETPETAGTSAGSATSDVVAMIIEKNGPWQAKIGEQLQRLRAGNGIRNGWLLEPLTPDATIRLVTVNGKYLSYPGDLDYKKAINLQRNPSGGSAWWNAVIGLFSASSSDGIAPLSGEYPVPGAVALRDSVVNINSGKLDISSIFVTPADGQYQIQFDRMRADGTVELVGEPFSATFQRDKPDVADLSNASAGLYRVTVTPQDGCTTGDTAWILVANPETYDKYSASFKKAVDMTSTKDQQLTPGALRWFLRTYLSLLDKQTTPLEIID